MSISPLRHGAAMLAGTALFALAPPAAHAQSAPAPAPDQAEAEPNVITVVGSQIKRSAVAGTLPVTVVDAQAIATTGAISGDDLFRTLPSNGSLLTNNVNFNAGINAVRGDVASINLRSLGTGNTLTLINGRRMVQHPGSQSGEESIPITTYNMNSLPVLGVQRVEVLRDGASALYGADAVAGVVNTVLQTDYEGLKLSATYRTPEQTSSDELVFNGQAGFSFNEGRTRLSLFGSFSRQTALHTRDRWFSRSEDKRDLVAGTDFEGDLDFRGTTDNTPWGQFALGRPVRQNGNLITSATGLFHIQPGSYAGCTAQLSDSLCLDDGRIDESLWLDRNADRDLFPAVRRTNLFAVASHEFSQQAELYAEISYYGANSVIQREGLTPLATTPLVIPANNYWNPFGPVRFSDGRLNPNRLPGIDAPEEGIPIVINNSATGTRVQLVDTGPIVVDVDTSSYRALLGLRGQIGNWDYDAAALYSEARTRDTSNLVSSTLFQRALANETSSAYNLFNGGSLTSPTVGDGTPNPQSVIDAITVDATRLNKTSLFLADFKVSNPRLVSLWAGDVGFAAGVEFRHETLTEDRDPRQDGTITFTDLVTGVNYASDILGSSASADLFGKRDVYSAFAELTVPLVNPDLNIPLMRRLDIQLAGRVEHFSDVGGVFTPRFTASWEVIRGIKLRGAYAEGFKAPNLILLNSPPTGRVSAVRDWYRCQAALNKGQIATLGACGTVGNAQAESLRISNVDLKPEYNNSHSFGVVLEPLFVPGLTITADYWSIKQRGIHGLFGLANFSALDYAARLAGGSEASVIRQAITPEDIAFFAGSGLAPAGEIIQVLDPFLNLDSRLTRGIDIAVDYRLSDTPLGDFRFGIQASRLLEAYQTVSSQGAEIIALNEPAIAVSAGGDLLEQNGRPKWQGNASLNWASGNWSAGAFAQYVGAFDNTGAINDVTNAFYRVGSWFTVNTNVEYRFALSGSDVPNARLRLGVNNLFDRDPPLTNGAIGYNAGLHTPFGRTWYATTTVEF
ncbi:TonB-dependent receptor [Altererythrobacter xixiisoli]|uniref:TonB-dependent receptor n=1 Tax=Croceibacterium xixiisoli TaxID=1476466 RepID=A0A6I4TTZ3_9SPHN|nr:TonB-dependent receptor [Croceibacterium xixiisoli]MXO99312.1 TonB-dependent receptor [Croceibacterium xixiisoli]